MALEYSPPKGAIDARSVHNRAGINAFLSQSLSGEYLSVADDGEIRQTSTFAKSYVVEGHGVNESGFTKRLQSGFPHIVERQDPSLLLLFDKESNPYFLDRSDDRFLKIHTIAAVAKADEAVGKLAQSGTTGFDRAWMPTEFLFAAWRHRLTGFKFRFERVVAGTTDEDLHEIPHRPRNTEDNHRASRRARFRLTVNEDLSALDDYRDIEDGSTFRGRKCLEHVQFYVRADDDYISNGIYSNGKIIGSGTSISLHMMTVDLTASRYSETLARIEEASMGWVQSDGKFVHAGVPFVLTFPEDLVITDLSAFAASIFQPSKPFRLLGLPHNESAGRLDIEAIDLHTGDSFAVELTANWMRVYLPKRACGNVLLRLYANLQHSMHSGIEMLVAGEEPIFPVRPE